jgi:hypothetical protein
MTCSLSESCIGFGPFVEACIENSAPKDVTGDAGSPAFIDADVAAGLIFVVVVVAIRDDLPHLLLIACCGCSAVCFVLSDPISIANFTHTSSRFQFIS